jgi:hypothetical protein
MYGTRNFPIKKHVSVTFSCKQVTTRSERIAFIPWYKEAEIIHKEENIFTKKLMESVLPGTTEHAIC